METTTSNYAISVQGMFWLLLFSGISFYLLQKQANFHKWKSQSEVFLWWATMLTVSVKDAGNLVCIFVRNRVYLCYFFLVTKAKLPPPRKMHECTWEVCTVCLLQCTTLCAVSWGIELGFELELVSRSNENFSLGCVLFFSRGLYVHGAI